MTKRLFYGLPLLILLVIAGYFGWQLKYGQEAHLVPSPLLEKPVPDFSLMPLLPDVPGLSQKDLNGQISLVNIFASWCIPCRAEHPLLMQLARENHILMTGIAYKDKKESATDFLKELGNPFHKIGFDENGRVAIEWGVYGVPETYIIDQKGIIRYKRTGPLTAAILQDDILPLIKRLHAQ